MVCWNVCHKWNRTHGFNEVSARADATMSAIPNSFSLSFHADPSSTVYHLLPLPTLSLCFIGIYRDNHIWDVWFVGTCGVPEFADGCGILR